MAEMTLGKGESFTLVAYTAPDFASDHTVTWSSSDTNIATVDDKGTIMAVEVGSAIITAAANDASGLKAACVLTVEENTGVESVVGSRPVDEATYDLQGRRMDNPTKGIYIVGNKKVVIK